MAHPVVEATNTGSNASLSTTQTLNLPTGIQAGDLLVMAVGLLGNVTTSWPSGWNVIKVLQVSTNQLEIAWREADGTEGATINITTGSTTRNGHVSYRISGAEDPSTQPPQASTGVIQEADSANPDPDSLTPTGGSKDYLWIAAESNNGSSTTAAPTNYTLVSGGTGGGGGGANCGTGHRQLTASSTDPGTFTLSGNQNWTAVTVAVHPTSAAGGQTLTGTLFQKAPTFNAGTVTVGAVDLAGTLFQNTPTFGGGTVAAGAQDLTGDLFQSTPTFGGGAVTAGAVDLAGTLFQNTPVFNQGTVAASFDLTGTLFESTPTFPQGAVGAGAVALSGTLFANHPVFFAGALAGGDIADIDVEVGQAATRWATTPPTEQWDTEPAVARWAAGAPRRT